MPWNTHIFSCSFVFEGFWPGFPYARPAALTQQAISWPRLPGALDAMDGWQPAVPRSDFPNILNMAFNIDTLWKSNMAGRKIRYEWRCLQEHHL